MRTRSFTPTNIRRTNRANTESRLRHYPVEAWLSTAVDLTADLPADAQLTEHIATPEVDFEMRVTPTQFQQDLHRIAREASKRARALGEPLGYSVRTSRKGLEPGEQAFYFVRIPIAEVLPALRLQEAAEGQAFVPTPPGTPPSTADEVRRTNLWHDYRSSQWYCDDLTVTPHRHVIGYGDTCPSCHGRVAVDPGETPPSGWAPPSAEVSSARP